MSSRATQRSYTSITHLMCQPLVPTDIITTTSSLADIIIASSAYVNRHVNSWSLTATSYHWLPPVDFDHEFDCWLFWCPGASYQCYEYCFEPRFDLAIGTKYFGTGLFRRTVSGYFGVTLFYSKKYIYILLIKINK